MLNGYFTVSELIVEYWKNSNHTNTFTAVFNRAILLFNGDIGTIDTTTKWWRIDAISRTNANSSAARPAAGSPITPVGHSAVGYCKNSNNCEWSPIFFILLNERSSFKRIKDRRNCVLNMNRYHYRIHASLYSDYRKRQLTLLKSDGNILAVYYVRLNVFVMKKFL